MKKIGNWFFPDGERHLIEWMASPKGHLVVNGRESYQGKKQLRAMDFVPKDKRRVAIDIGSHIGLWSYNLAHWFGSVKAFEPVVAHRECFLKNVFESENAPWDLIAAAGSKHSIVKDGEIQHVDYFGGDKIALYPFALGDREDMIHITTGPTSSGDSWVKGKGQIPMKTLDSLAFENVDFIKIDTEGYEEFILRGAEDLIERCRPVICVEQKRDMSATRYGLKPLSAVKFLIDRGYKTADSISGDYIMVPA